MSPVAVHHVTDGPDEAPVVVLSGPLGGSLAIWEPQLQPLLAAGFRVVRYDHRGHAASPVPPGPYAIADLADDLLALLDRIGAARAHVVGLSLGGMTALWAAAHAPDRIDRMVIGCSSACLPPATAWLDRAAIVRASGMEAVAEAVVGRWLTPDFAGRHPEVASRLRAMFVATPPEGYAAACEAIAAMDLTPILPRVAAPTLVFAAADDLATPPDHGRRVAAGLPHAGFAMVEDAAHHASVEQAGVVSRLIVQHLTTHQGGAKP